MFGFPSLQSEVPVVLACGNGRVEFGTVRLATRSVNDNGTHRFEYSERDMSPEPMQNILYGVHANLTHLVHAPEWQEGQIDKEVVR